MQTMGDYERTTRDFAYFGDSHDWLMAFASCDASDIVTRANCEALKRGLPEGSFRVETFKVPLSGVHGEWVLIDPANADAIEWAEGVIAELESYPVIDDEVLSELEYDEAYEAAGSACAIARDDTERQAAAPFIVHKSDENERGVGYSNEYWPTDADVFFGYLAYRRHARQSGKELDSKGNEGFVLPAGARFVHVQ